MWRNAAVAVLAGVLIGGCGNLLTANAEIPTTMIEAYPQLETPRPYEGMGVKLDAETTEKLLDFADKYSRYEKPKNVRPEVILVSSDWMLLFTGTNRYAGVFFYNEKNRVYIAADGVEPEAVMSTTVHELTHWMQRYYGAFIALEKEDECVANAAEEAEAYAVDYVFGAIELGRKMGYSTPEWLCNDLPSEY